MHPQKELATLLFIFWICAVKCTIDCALKHIQEKTNKQTKKIQNNKQTNKQKQQTNKQTNKQTNSLTNKQINQQTNKFPPHHCQVQATSLLNNQSCREPHNRVSEERSMSSGCDQQHKGCFFLTVPPNFQYQ